MKRYSLLVCLMCLVPLAHICAQISPAGGERWKAGGMYEIRWSAEEFPAGAVDISLWDGNRTTWHYVATCASQAGSYVWKVPDGLSGDLFRIRIQSREDPSVLNMSDSYFFILTSTEPGPPGGGGAGPVDSVARSVRLSPNPATETVTAYWEGGAAHLRVWDVPGRTVLNFPLGGQSTLAFSVADLLPGFYIVEVKRLDGIPLHGRLLVTR